ncbi:MAG: diacylglycerol kinase family protein [Limnohabitans sp.]|jgi:diacylglycerol kinase|uniref:diacylglycerol kinase family protein n=1 Tax=Limnohabitans sp. TaxID=1907725 RepID=UPI00391A8031
MLAAMRAVARSFGHAARGLRVLMAQRNARVHLVAALLVLVLGVWLGLSTLEWALVSLAIALVIGAEALNTGIELAVNLAQPEWHAVARDAKDVAAAGVLVCSLGAVAVGGWVLGPKLWALI